MNNSISQESLEQRVAQLEREKTLLQHQVMDLQQINTKLNSETKDLKKTKRDLYKQLNVAQKSDVKEEEKKEAVVKKDDKNPWNIKEALSSKAPVFDMHSTNWPSLAGAMAGR